MVPAKLVAHFVGDIINVIGVAHRIAEARLTPCFLGCLAHHAKSGQTAAARAEDMPNVKIGGADDCRQI